MSNLSRTRWSAEHVASGGVAGPEWWRGWRFSAGRVEDDIVDEYRAYVAAHCPSIADRELDALAGDFRSWLYLREEDSVYNRWRTGLAWWLEGSPGPVARAVPTQVAVWPSVGGPPGLDALGVAWRERYRATKSASAS